MLSVAIKPFALPPNNPIPPFFPNTMERVNFNGGASPVISYGSRMRVLVLMLLPPPPLLLLVVASLLRPRASLSQEVKSVALVPVAKQFVQEWGRPKWVVKTERENESMLVC